MPIVLSVAMATTSNVTLPQETYTVLSRLVNSSVHMLCRTSEKKNGKLKKEQHGLAAIVMRGLKLLPGTVCA